MEASGPAWGVVPTGVAAYMLRVLEDDATIGMSDRPRGRAVDRIPGEDEKWDQNQFSASSRSERSRTAGS